MFLLEQVLECIGVIHRHNMEELLRYSGNTVAERFDRWLGVPGSPVVKVLGPHDQVGHAVVAAFHDNVPIFTCKRPRNTHRGHHGFGPGVGESDKLGGGHHLADPTGNLVFSFGRQRKYAADVHPLACSCVHALICVTQDDRSVAQSVVDVLIAVDVPHAPALAVVNINRLVIPPVTEVGRDPQGQLGDGLFEVLVRAGQLTHRKGIV